MYWKRIFSRKWYISLIVYFIFHKLFRLISQENLSNRSTWCYDWVTKAVRWGNRIKLIWILTWNSFQKHNISNFKTFKMGGFSQINWYLKHQTVHTIIKLTLIPPMTPCKCLSSSNIEGRLGPSPAVFSSNLPLMIGLWIDGDIKLEDGWYNTDKMQI